jgi:hypothetical protein
VIKPTPRPTPNAIFCSGVWSAPEPAVDDPDEGAAPARFVVGVAVDDPAEVAAPPFGDIDEDVVMI